MNSITAEQMKEIDKETIEKYGIDEKRLVENAGYQVANFIRQEIDVEKLTVYAGKGNNGADALAAARRLNNWGFQIEVVLVSKELTGIRKEELEILRNQDVEINLKESNNNYKTAIEGLIGYNLKGDPKKPFNQIIKKINQKHSKIISIDIPTGIETDKAKTKTSYVNSDHTVTLAAPFNSMEDKKELFGNIWVADISVPRKIYETKGMDYFFEEKSLIKYN